jgi:hypothetical protein
LEEQNSLETHTRFWNHEQLPTTHRGWPAGGTRNCNKGGQEDEDTDDVIGKEEGASGHSDNDHSLSDSNSSAIEVEDVRERWI